MLKVLKPNVSKESVTTAQFFMSKVGEIKLKSSKTL